MSTMDDMPVPNLTGADDNETRQPQILGWAIAMMVLSFVAVVLRFVSRHLVRNKFQLDDWLAVASLPFAWMMCLISIWGVIHDHFGLHIGRSTFGSLRHYLIGLWVFDIVYAFAITLSKLSIMALWWRIFEVKSCHIVLGSIAVMEILWLVGVTLVTIFSCVPVEGFWNLLVPSKCIVQSQFWLGSAIPNIFFDVALLIIPNFYIYQLSISKSQKLGLSFIFMLGTFVTVCSVLRLWQLIIYNSMLETDLPWATSTTAIWSFVEGNLSVVCCCLPSMRPILRLIVHGRVNSTGRSGGGGYTSQNSRSRHSFRNSMRIPGMSKRDSRNAAQLPTMPMQRLSVGVSKKTEWWETTMTTHTSNGRRDDGVGGDSWPLPANAPRVLTPTVNTTIYAGDAPPLPAQTAKQHTSSRPGSGGGGHAKRSSKSSTASRNRTMAWPGWIENLQKPSPSAIPGPQTWLQLEDSPMTGTPEGSPKVSAEHTRGGNTRHEHTASAEVSVLTYSSPSEGPHAVSTDDGEVSNMADKHSDAV